MFDFTRKLLKPGNWFHRMPAASTQIEREQVEKFVTDINTVDHSKDVQPPTKSEIPDNSNCLLSGQHKPVNKF